MDSPKDCLFHHLKYLADFVVNEINEDIELLRIKDLYMVCQYAQEVLGVI